MLGYRRMVCLALVALGVWLALPNTASALPSCSQARPAAVEGFSVPPQLAWGRYTDPYHYFPSYQADPMSGRPRITSTARMHVSFEAANPTDPITFPLEQDTKYDNIVASISLPYVKFRKGDGPGRVTWTWEETDFISGDASCERTVSTTIAPVRGHVPKRVKTHIYRNYRGDYIEFAFPHTCDNQPTAATGEMVFVVKQIGGPKKRLKLHDQCGKIFSPSYTKARGWYLEEFASCQCIDLKVKTGAPGKFDFRWTYRFGGKKRDSGSVGFSAALG